MTASSAGTPPVLCHAVRIRRNNQLLEQQLGVADLDTRVKASQRPDRVSPCPFLCEAP